MHKFEIILYWSNEDRAFIAEVPELPGMHGAWRHPGIRSPERINEAMDLWIDTARRVADDPVPQPKGERLMLA